MRKTPETRFSELMDLMIEKNFDGSQIHWLLESYDIQPNLIATRHGLRSYIFAPENISDAIAEVNHTNYK